MDAVQARPGPTSSTGTPSRARRDRGRSTAKTLAPPRPRDSRATCSIPWRAKISRHEETRRHGRKRSDWPIAPGPSTSSGTTPSRAIGLTVHFTVPKAGTLLGRTQPVHVADYGRQKLSVNGKTAEIAGVRVDARSWMSPTLGWIRPSSGVFDLKEGDNTLRSGRLSRTRRRSRATSSAWIISSSSSNEGVKPTFFRKKVGLTPS